MIWLLGLSFGSGDGMREGVSEAFHVRFPSVICHSERRKWGGSGSEESPDRRSANAECKKNHNSC
jgi:hypothetical protein